MSACPNQSPDHGIEPFIVEAKVLRPGLASPIERKVDVEIDSLVRWIEVFAIIPFTIVAIPLAFLGFCIGAVGLVTNPGEGLVFFVPATVGAWGLLALWVLLTRNEESLVKNPAERRFVLYGIVAGMLLDFLYLVPAIASRSPMGILFVASPSIVAAHRGWRLVRALRTGPQTKAPLMQRIRVHMALVLQNLSKLIEPAKKPERHAKWGARW